jgi:DNA-directed RNA polymerase subunit omega
MRKTPSIDGALKKVNSRYDLVLKVAERAREINGYFAGLSEGLLENEAPKVDMYKGESSINIALDEISAGKLD